MRRCPNCGETELNDADYCEKCGVKIEQVDTASPNESATVSDTNVQDEHETAKESEGKPTESAETSEKEPMSKKRIAIIVFCIIYFLIRIFGSDGDDSDKKNFPIPVVENTATSEEFYDKATGIWVDKNTVRLSNGQVRYLYVAIDNKGIIVGDSPQVTFGGIITKVERGFGNRYTIHVHEIKPEDGRKVTQDIVFSEGKIYFKHDDERKYSRISYGADESDILQVEREMRDYYRRYR